jgi:hypothetical protein
MSEIQHKVPSHREIGTRWGRSHQTAIASKMWPRLLRTLCHLHYSYFHPWLLLVHEERTTFEGLLLIWKQQNIFKIKKQMDTKKSLMHTVFAQNVESRFGHWKQCPHRDHLLHSPKVFIHIYKTSNPVSIVICTTNKEQTVILRFWHFKREITRTVRHFPK